MEAKKDTVSSNGGNGAAQSQTRAEWGIYVYFAADVPDPDMQNAVWSTLGTLASVGSTDDIKITAMIDLPRRDTEYYILPERPFDPKITRWAILPDRFLPNVDSASKEAILDFFGWSHRNCPAKNIALVFWGHGYRPRRFRSAAGVKRRKRGPKAASPRQTTRCGFFPRQRRQGTQTAL